MNELNRVFDYPQWSIPLEQQNSLLTTALVLAGVTLAYAIWTAWREKDTYPLFLFIGAGLAVIYEPLGDILTGVVYPPLEQVSLMTSFGRPIPLWLLPNYCFFIGLPALLLIRYLMKPSVSTRTWWITYVAIVLAVGLFEQPGLGSGFWRYYKENQAFSISTYPVWVAFANAQGLFIVAAGVHLLRNRILNRRTSVLLVLLVPMLFAGSHLAGHLPVAWALYTFQDSAIVNAASIVAVAMCILSMWIALKCVQGSGDTK